MVSSPEKRSQNFGEITESKIVHVSPVLHPLARFITEETAALLFDIHPDEIYEIKCLRYVVHVHGKGVSRFVSYADFTPILNVFPPTSHDFVLWRKRWRKKPPQEFWKKFYRHKFETARSPGELFEWGNLVAVVKSLLSPSTLQQLRDVYTYNKNWLDF